jgi:hypothetical protein
VSRAGAVVLVGVLASGCGGLRRAAVNTVDPALRSQPRLERSRADGGFRLGRYTIVKERLTESATGVAMSDAPSDPAHPGWRYRLNASLRVVGVDRVWTTRCTGERQPSVDADFGAVATEPNDLVAIDCDIAQGEARWRLTARGRLDGNIAGELAPPQGGTPLQVEIVMWAVRVKVFKRRLAEPVAQVRGRTGAIAAMILSRPEWAWVDARAPVESSEAAMTALAAVRLLPLGFED